MPLGSRVVLIRHGQTDWSKEGRHTGWRDIPLNEAGIDEARQLAPWVAQLPVESVFCSPLQRARSTCRECGLLDRAVIDDDLKEWNYGECEGRTRDEIRESRPGWDIWKDGVVGGETFAQLADRADRVIARLQATEGLVAVFAHGHIIRVITARWVMQEPVFAQDLSLGTACVGVLGYEHTAPVICGWNYSVR